MQNVLIWASNVLVFSSYLVYEWAILKGKAKPHRTTRLVLTIITVLGFLSVIAQGTNPALAWFLGICSFHCLLILLLSIRKGMGGWAPSDIVCLLIAVFGILLWKVTSNPVLALYAAVAADCAGMIPALIKTYRLPHTEYYLSSILDLAAIILTLFAIENGGFNEYLYPTYLFIVGSVMLVFIFRKKVAV